MFFGYIIMAQTKDGNQGYESDKNREEERESTHFIKLPHVNKAKNKDEDANDQCEKNAQRRYFDWIFAKPSSLRSVT